MATWLDRLRRRKPLLTHGTRGTLRTESLAGAELESIEAALADAEELAQRTRALARDLHRLLARGIARRRDDRRSERVLH